ncbi:MAG: protein translocase subunit SecF [Candidatus Doudnabacteria bacterium]|nr:protein translocase subunit SecF [Candidatus Doudnabacteria bacterium]
MNDQTEFKNKPTVSGITLTGFSVTKHYKIWFAISGTLVITSIVLLSTWKLVPGIDFRGGTLSELEFVNPVDTGQIKNELTLGKFGNVTVQPLTDRRIIIKTAPIDEAQLENFRKTLQEKFGAYTEARFESIGPSIGRELAKKAYWQILLVLLGIVLYVTYAFRKIGKQMKQGLISSWVLGAAALAALFHDLIIPAGFFAILGKFHGVEIDSLFITALLTILGFSVHDTIVVFDRIREYMHKYPYKSIQTIIDYSVVSTMARSINTSSTLVFVLVAMFLFGGETISNFVLALLVGVIAGTYSSVFIASPIVYLWCKRKARV